MQINYIGDTSAAWLYKTAEASQFIAIRKRPSESGSDNGYPAFLLPSATYYQSYRDMSDPTQPRGWYRGAAKLRDAGQAREWFNAARQLAHNAQQQEHEAIPEPIPAQPEPTPAQPKGDPAMHTATIPVPAPTTRAPAPTAAAIGGGILDGLLAMLSDSMRQQVDEYINQNYGKLPRADLVVKVRDKETTIPGNRILHRVTDKVIRAIDANIPVYLYGPAGSGKTQIAMDAAAALQLEFYFNNALTDETRITGYIALDGRFMETEFYRAFKSGGLYCLDEADASDPNVLVTLNAAIANRIFTFPNGERITAHSDFRVIACANTVGRGADRQYVGRNQLDGASTDRFYYVHVTYDKRIIEALSGSSELTEFITAAQEALEKTGMRYVISYRAAKYIGQLRDVEDDDYLILAAVFKGMSKEHARRLTDGLPKSNRWTKAAYKAVEALA